MAWSVRANLAICEMRTSKARNVDLEELHRHTNKSHLALEGFASELAPADLGKEPRGAVTSFALKDVEGKRADVASLKRLARVLGSRSDCFRRALPTSTSLPQPGPRESEKCMAGVGQGACGPCGSWVSGVLLSQILMACSNGTQVPPWHLELACERRCVSSPPRESKDNNPHYAQNCFARCLNKTRVTRNVFHPFAYNIYIYIYTHYIYIYILYTYT